jgi:hypothetical protein
MNVRCNDLSRRAELYLLAPHFLCLRGCGGNHHAHRDGNPDAANLTAQGLQRSLPMAPYPQQKVLSNNNVTAICALEPMTHLLTTSGYPEFDRLISTAHLMP